MQQPFADIAPRYDRLNDLISMRLHRRWKQRLVDKLLQAYGSTPHAVLDIATGTGDVVRLLQKRLPEKRTTFFGLDPCKEMLELAKKKPSNIDWILGASESLPFADNSVSLISCAFGVRNFTDRPKALSEWQRILEPGGVAAILEIHPIPKAWFRTPLKFYWRVLLPRLGQIYGHKQGYTYLRDTSMGFVTPEELSEEIKAAGLSPVSRHSFFAKGMVTLSILKKVSA